MMGVKIPCSDLGSLESAVMGQGSSPRTGARQWPLLQFSLCLASIPVGYRPRGVNKAWLVVIFSPPLFSGCVTSALSWYSGDWFGYGGLSMQLSLLGLVSL